MQEVVIVSLTIKTSEYTSLSLLKYANVRKCCLQPEFRPLIVKKSRHDDTETKITIYLSNYLFNLKAELRSV